MREDQVYRFLCEVIEGRAAGNNIPKEDMIILNMRLLVRGIGITKEKPCFSVTIQIVFESEDIRKLSAVVCEDSRKELTEVETILLQLTFQSGNFCASLRCCFIV